MESELSQAEIVHTLRVKWRQRNFFHGEEKAIELRMHAECKRRMGEYSRVEPETGKRKTVNKGQGAQLYRAVMQVSKPKRQKPVTGDALGNSDVLAALELSGDGVGEEDVAAAAGNATPLPVFSTFLYVEPLTQAHAIVEEERQKYQRDCQVLARQLSVWPWVEAIRGLGALGLAAIVGEAGDLGNYAGPQKLNKRLGLGVTDGRADRRIAGKSEARKLLAIEMGYSPRRRSVMWTIGDALIKGNQDGRYRSFYLAEKERLAAERTELRPFEMHRMAQRAMEKGLLRDLWCAWNDRTVMAGKLWAA